jgi:hypothetical protein
MKFTPKSDEELLNLLPDGDYDFVVIKAEDTISKSGNEMIKLTLKVLDHQGNERQIFDYLLEAMAFKVKHFAQAVGLDNLYELGGYEASDCLHRTGRCTIGKEESQNGYQPKNKLVDYIKRDPNEKIIDPQKDSELLNDEIPF